MLLGTITAGFFVIALAGVPIVWALIATTLLANESVAFPYPLEAVFLNFVGGIEPFHLVAVPLFILAGDLMGRGGIGARLIDFARALFGFLPGGLGIVTVVACLMFGAVSGSAIAAAAAIGGVMVPGMVKKGYAPAFASALIACAGTLGIIIPPSIPMLVFAFVANISVAELFIAGIVPGLLFGVALIAVCVWEGKRTGCDAGGQPASRAEIAATFRACAPALLMPVVILGGIYSGAFTPTEAAAVACAYALLVSMLVYRSLKLRDLPGILFDSFQTSAVVMLVIGATSALAWIITAEQVPAQLTAMVQGVATSRWMFLLMLNIILLLLGIFLEPLPAMLLTAPLFLPAAAAFGVDPVHLGLIFTCNLAIGLYSPPVGGTLFVAAKIGNVGMAAISRALIPLFLASLVVMALVTYIEALPMALVWAGR
jgi:C4-dicarboxylate transporter, DctM subunit